jgi:hypothetical protein
VNQYVWIGIGFGLVWFAIIVAFTLWAHRNESGHPV